VRLIAAGALVVALACAGCYGSTEPATDIGLHGAHLHGAGTANNGPAGVFFQLWPSAFPARVQETRHVDVPDGTSGPFSRSTEVQLALDTEYSFRLCADEGGGPICAQTRTFRMPKPAGDAVIGDINQAYEFRPLFVEAQSDASGGAPTGHFSVAGRFSGTVISMTVVGRRAAVLARGTAQRGTDTFAADACATIGDAGPDAPRGSGDFADVNIVLTDFGQTIGSCIPPQADFRGNQDGVSVYDAP
jgi:hypothetical protein